MYLIFFLSSDTSTIYIYDLVVLYTLVLTNDALVRNIDNKVPMTGFLAGSTKLSSSPPPLWKLRSSRCFIITVICFACFTDIFLYGIIVPVIPFALLTRVHIPQDHVQHWNSILFAVYAAALTAFSPFCGWLADFYKSRRLPYIGGLFALAGATVMLCVGNSLTLLVLGRIVQGIAAAVVTTVGLALLVDTVGHGDIGQASGWVSISISIAYLVAPLLGGVVYAQSSYYAVYYMAFSLIAVDIVLRIMLIERKHVKRWEGSVTPAAEQPKPSLAVSRTEDANSPQDSSSKSKIHLAPVISLLSSGRLLSAIWCTFAQATILTSWDAVLPLRVANLFQWTSLGAGLIFLPLTIPSFAAPAVGWYSDKKGPRLPVFLGFLIGAPFLVLLRVVNHSGTNQIVVLCVLMAFLGVTMTMVVTPLLAEFTYVVDAEERRRGPHSFGDRGAYAQAYGLFMTAFAGGMLVGPLWAGLIVTAAGWETMAWTLGLLSAVSAIPAGLFTGGYIWDKRKKREKTETLDEERLDRRQQAEKSSE